MEVVICCDMMMKKAVLMMFNGYITQQHYRSNPATLAGDPPCAGFPLDLLHSAWSLGAKQGGSQ